MTDTIQSTLNVKKRNSFYTTSSERSYSRSNSKSDANIYYNTAGAVSGNLCRSENVERGEGFYKNYEHDEIPVKDDSSFNDHSFSEDNDLRVGDNKDSVTNSDLDNLEIKILRKMSQELQMEDTSISSLDSNIKLFKTTVEQIFDNFYKNMQDFDIYKKKFNDILEKNRGDSFSEMEDFIKDMIQNIASSDSSISPNQVKGKSAIQVQTNETQSRECKINVNRIETNVSNSLNSTVDTFLNDNYLTGSTFDNENSSNGNNASVKTEETFNIYLLSGTPCVEIKMTNRKMLSEINIKNHNIDRMENQLASAENIKKLADKKLEMENYAKVREVSIKDRDIPVKISNAKKSIYLDEDFTYDEKEESKFFIFKICNYICRKLRKN